MKHLILLVLSALVCSLPVHAADPAYVAYERFNADRNAQDSESVKLEHASEYFSVLERVGTRVVSQEACLKTLLLPLQSVDPCAPVTVVANYAAVSQRFMSSSGGGTGGVDDYYPTKK